MLVKKGRSHRIKEMILTNTKRKIVRFTNVSPHVLTFLLGFSLISQSAIAQDEQNKWHGHIEAEGKWGSERSLGEIGAFLPVWQNEKTLVFGDVRGRFDDQSTSEGNFGGGIRYQVTDQWIVGGYGFYDRRHTRSNNTFEQATIGAEALSENWEMRINGYIPESDEKTVNAGISSTTGLASGGTLQLSTTTSGGVVERALPGFDMEVGHRFELPGNWEFSTYGGGFHFEADDYSKVSGPRGRAELSYKNTPYLGDGSKVTLGFEAQHDDVRDTQSWGIARIRIPLNYNNAKKTSELSSLDQHMTTRINRDVDIVSSPKSMTATTTTETASITTPTGQTVNTYTILDGNDDIDADLLGAGMLVVLDGSNGILNASADINLAANQTVVGGGTTLTATGSQSGKSASITLPGSRATVDRNDNFSTAFETAGNNNLQNFNIQNALSGINITNADNTISGITIDNVNHGIYTNSNADRTQIENTEITQATIYGIYIDNSEDFTVSNTTIETTGHGIAIHGLTTSDVTLNTVTVDGGTRGVSINGAGTFDALSGTVTTTNTATPCFLGGAMVGVTNSTLTVNNVACP